MIGLVIITHAGLATEFKAALEHVVGPQEHLETLSIGPDDDIERRRQQLIEAVQRADTGSGVVVLTDMFGGTPSNLAISVMEATGAEVIAGVNLPMLIKLAGVRKDRPLVEAVNLAKEAGRKYISVASQVLSGTTWDGGRHEVEERATLSQAVTNRADVTIRNKKGLHARASAKFVNCAEGFSAQVRVSRDGQTVGGTSIMGLLTLAASQGTTITIVAEGPEAREALIALVALVRNGFGEEN